MRHLLLACACAVVISSPALACEVTAKYGAVKMQVALANISTAKKIVLQSKLEKSWAMNQLGEQKNRRVLIRKSVADLKKIKAKVSQ